MRKVTLIAIAILAVGSIALAGQAQTARGMVESVSGNTVTIAGEDGQMWTFEATDQTMVVAEGAAHRSEELAAVGRKTTLNELVRENQHVIVKFSEDGDTRYIKKLRVL